MYRESTVTTNYVEGTGMRKVIVWGKSHAFLGIILSKTFGFCYYAMTFTDHDSWFH